MTSFEADLKLLAEAVEAEKRGGSILRSSVILLTFRGMLKIEGSNLAVRKLCYEYIHGVSTRTEKQGPDHDAWCDIIVKGLDSALEGDFNRIDLPVEKMQNALDYNGPLKSTICRNFPSEF